DARVLQTFARTLRLAGYVVHTAEGGEDGLALYHYEQPDIVMLDLRMPGLDGLTTLQAIRAHDPEANVILVTGHGEKDDVIAALRAGASDFLPKPIDQVALESALRRAEERIHLKRKLCASQESLRLQNEHLEEQVAARTAELEREIEERKQANAALRESEARERARAADMETILDTVPAVIWIAHDPQGRHITGNPASYRLLRMESGQNTSLTPDEGQSLPKFKLHFDGAEVPIEQLPIQMACQYGTETRNHEGEIVFEDGTRRTIFGSTVPLRDEQGRIRGAVAAYVDITDHKRIDEALHESKERFEKTFRSQRDAIFILNANRPALIVDCNPAATRIFGYAHDEMVGRPATFLHVNEAALHRFQEQLFPAIQAQGYLHLPEFQMKRKDGTLFFSEHHVMPLENEPGERVGWVSVVRDITDRKQVEAALREGEQRMDLALRGADLGTWDWNVRTGSVVFNARWAEMLGYTLDQIDPHVDAWEKLLHPDDRPGVVEALDAHLDGKTEIYETTHRLRHASGEWVWILDKGRVIERDAEGRPLRVCGTHLDITASKQMEEALRQSEQKYRYLFEHAPIGIFYTSFQGQPLSINVAMARMLGFDTPQAALAYYDDLATQLYVHAERREAFLQLLFEKGVVENFEYEARTADGRTIWLSMNARVESRDAHGRMRIEGFTTDVTARKQAEQALRQTFSQLEGIKQHSPDLITMIDREGRYVMVNQAAAQVLGGAPEHIVGKTFAELLPPEVAETFMARIRMVFETERLLEVEDKSTGPNGESVYTTILFPLFDQDGRCYAISGIARDITERRRTEEALRESLERLDAMIQASPLGIISLTPDGIVTTWSAGAERIFGWTAAQAVGRMHPIVAEDNQEVFRELRERVMRGESLYGVELTRRRKDGSLVEISLSTAPLRDAEGHITGIMSTVEDITQRVQTEAERAQLMAQIQDQTRQLREVMRTVPEGVLVLNARGDVLLANPAAEHVLPLLSNARMAETITHLGGTPLEELLTSPPHGLWHEVQTGSRTFEIVARPVANGPEPEKWVLVIRDVTDKRSVERRVEMQERLAAVGQLSAGIAHDFNNIIAVISLYAQMGAHDDTLPPKFHERMQVIAQQTHRAADLVQQVLEFSRQTVLDRRPMDLLLFVKEQVKLLERTIPENVEIGLTYEDDTFLVSADPTRMQQVMLNLAVNARDAMPQGGRLSIDLARVQVEESKYAPLPRMQAGDWVRVAVADTGTGIPADVMPHLFEPFFTTKPPGEGTGLGLAQVWGIVNQHNGYVDVTSTPGKGATFTLYLPALAVWHSEPASPAEADLPRGAGQTILVVEDNPAVRAAMVDILETLNYRVLTAANGQNALEVLEEHAPRVALVMSDLVMPVMGGVALFHTLKETHPHLKVVLLTGHPMEGELKELCTQGLSGYLLKPHNTEQLAAVVSKVLQGEPS
ncbi:MAG: PAS domain S-box protein, partial [Anaerolineae bacterium]|nr:PAS domain S-box protein [Anaerolineae bacterium]